MTSYDVIVVGAGISGLACAHTLKANGHSVLVLEASSDPGGLIRSEQRDGYLLEYGPNSLRRDSIELASIIDAVGLRARISEPLLKRTRNYVASAGRLIPVPRSPFDLFATPLLSASDKLKIITEPFRRNNAEGDDETVAAFFRRRFGNRTTEMLVKPMMSGIYAGDAEKLSLQSAFPRFEEYERLHGSLVLGMLRSPKTQKPDLPRTFSFQSGLSELPTAISKSLGDIVKKDHPVHMIEKIGDRWIVTSKDNERFDANNIVLTTPLYQLGQMLPPEINKSIPQVYYPGLTIVHLAYQTGSIDHALDGFGFLVTPAEQSTVLGCIFSSALFSGRAPEGKSLFTVLIGGATNPAVMKYTDEEKIELADTALRKYLNISAPAVFSACHTIEHSIPQYEQGHQDSIAQLDAIELRNKGLYFAGNYRGGISIGSCIAEGTRTGLRISR